MEGEQTKIDIAERAKFFRVSERTVYRWIRDNVDVGDPRAVGFHLLEQRAPSPEAIEAILESLEN